MNIEAHSSAPSQVPATARSVYTTIQGVLKKKRATQNIHKQNSKIAPSLMGPYGFENFEGFFFHLNLLIMSDRTVKYEDNVIQNYKLNFIKNIKIKYRT